MKSDCYRGCWQRVSGYVFHVQEEGGAATGNHPALDHTHAPVTGGGVLHGEDGAGERRSEFLVLADDHGQIRGRHLGRSSCEKRGHGETGVRQPGAHDETRDLVEFCIVEIEIVQPGQLRAAGESRRRAEDAKHRRAAVECGGRGDDVAHVVVVNFTDVCGDESRAGIVGAYDEN